MTSLIMSTGGFAGEVQRESNTDAREWRSFAESLAPIADDLVPRLSNPQDPQLKQELYRFLVSQLAGGYMGYKAGYIWGRLDTCEKNDNPTVRKIAVADVRKYLPQDVATVSAEQRDAALRERRKGAQLRRRW